MKATLKHFSLGLALIFTLSHAFSQPRSPHDSYAEMRGALWLTNYYGKTLSSLGDIVTIRIKHTTSADSQFTNSTVWKIIEHSKIQDSYSARVDLTTPPMFRIEYADGLQIRCTRYSATFFLPDGRQGPVLLLDQPPKKSPEPMPPAPADRRRG